MRLNLNSVTAGLQTETFIVPVAGIYKISCRTTAIPTSGVVLTVSQSGSQSVSYNSGPSTIQQSHMEISQEFDCAIGDVLTMAISSSNMNDISINQVKTTVALTQDL